MASRLVVAKTRAMVAREVGATIGATGWELGQLKRLSGQTLNKLAAKCVPGFMAYNDVGADSSLDSHPPRP